jgi:hypothetical protein
MRTMENERTLGEMFAELSRETRTLVQQEIQLAKTELGEKASAMGKGAGFIIGGGLIAYGGLLAIIASVVLGLVALGMPAWLGALVGGVIVAGAGYLLIKSGLAAFTPTAVKPTQTIETLKENAQWIKSLAK